MDDAAADVLKRLFIPRFPLLLLDGHVASSVCCFHVHSLFSRECRSYSHLPEENESIFRLCKLRINEIPRNRQLDRIGVYQKSINTYRSEYTFDSKLSVIASTKTSSTDYVRRWLYELIDNY